MPKLIAFYGSPGSGKTSIALKTAMETYIQTKDEIIAFLSPDMTVPSVALLFPNYAPDEVVSLSDIFDNTAITNESLLKNGVTVKNMKDFFALGFKAGENRYSFPTPTPEKINSLFSALSDVAGYIFVDCTNDETDEISKKALAIADAVVRIITPDLMLLATNTEGDTEKYEDGIAEIYDKIKILREQLEVAKIKASQSSNINLEMKRIIELFEKESFVLDRFDDSIIRRMVECIKVMGDKTIVVILKGGFEITEELN